MKWRKNSGLMCFFKIRYTCTPAPNMFVYKNIIFMIYLTKTQKIKTIKAFANKV